MPKRLPLRRKTPWAGGGGPCIGAEHRARRPCVCYGTRRGVIVNDSVTSRDQSTHCRAAASCGGMPNGISHRADCGQGPCPDHGRADHGNDIACRGTAAFGASLKARWPCGSRRLRMPGNPAPTIRLTSRDRPAARSFGEQRLARAGQRDPPALQHIGGRRSLSDIATFCSTSTWWSALAVEVADGAHTCCTRSRAPPSDGSSNITSPARP